MSVALKKLREDRNAVTTAMRGLVEKAETENRAFTSDEDSAWNKALADIAAIDTRMARVEALDKQGVIASSVKEIVHGRVLTDAANSEQEKRYAVAFRNALRLRPGQYLSQEDAQVFAAQEARAFAAGTSNVGGYTVPQGFYDVLDQALKATGAMWYTSEILNTDKGNVLPYPTFNYTAVAATIIGEGSASTVDSSTPFGVVNLNAYTYRSPLLPVSVEFLDDTAFDESFIIRGLTESIARGTNAHFTTGTGTSQPKGIVVAATAGKVGLAGQTLTVIYDDLVDLVASIDPAYRTPGDNSSIMSGDSVNVPHPKVGWMMKDLSIAIVRKLKDTSGRPLWIPSYEAGVTTGVPDTLLGYPVYVNQDVATMAVNAKSILFGRLDKYKIRKVKDYRLLRLVERYADQLQVGFNLFIRCDGNLIDAGTNPVKYYQNSAT